MSISETPDTGAEAGADESAHIPALKDVWSYLRLLLVAGIGVALDLWSKNWAFTRLPPEPIHGKVVIPHLMTFHRSLNTGALFGLGKGLTPVFIIASVLALGFVLFLFLNSSRDRRSLHVALALVLAGAVGNLYDRMYSIADVVTYSIGPDTVTLVGKITSDTDRTIMVGSWPEGARPKPIPKERLILTQQKGVVRDFIRMEPQLTIAGHTIDIWPWVFNIADALLVVGVGLLMLNFWWERRADQVNQPIQPDSHP